MCAIPLVLYYSLMLSSFQEKKKGPVPAASVKKISKDMLMYAPHKASHQQQRHPKSNHQ